LLANGPKYTFMCVYLTAEDKTNGRKCENIAKGYSHEMNAIANKI
jgi:hypothetical protein